jgi:predicted acylesterase/phospholipase RssA
MLATAMASIRFGLTISGASALGAFEGGALAALIGAVQHVQPLTPQGEEPALVIDAISGTSAGAITAVAAARALTAGGDPVWMMEQIWVVRDSLPILLHRASADAPLTVAGLIDMATDVLTLPPTRLSADRVQEIPLQLQIGLAVLRGLDYEIPRLQQAEPISASTYQDWSEFTFQPRADLPDFVTPPDSSAVDAAFASGASPLGFPPRTLLRDRALYADAGVTNLPESDVLWFTDGGAVNNEPLGRTLRMSNAIDTERDEGDHRRVHVLVHPFPSSPPPKTDPAWSSAPKLARPTWLEVLGRVFTIVRAQHLYDDLRQAEETNSRLLWQHRLVEALALAIDGLDPAGRARVVETLREVAAEIQAERARLPRRHRHAELAVAEAQDTADVLRAALQHVTGLAGKRAIGVEVITPRRVRRDPRTTLQQLLAGEFLFSFGGFFDEGLRRSDFALGYASMLNWMRTALGEYDLDPAVHQEVLRQGVRTFYGLGPWTMRGESRGFTDYGLDPKLTAMAETMGLRPGPSWQPADFSGASIWTLPLREKLRFGHILFRVARVASRDARIAWRRRRGQL